MTRYYTDKHPHQLTCKLVPQARLVPQAHLVPQGTDRLHPPDNSNLPRHHHAQATTAQCPMAGTTTAAVAPLGTLQAALQGTLETTAVVET